MLGPTHAASGAAVALAVAPAVEQVIPMKPAEIVLFAVLSAGCALLPDMDHPGSTVARTFGRPTRALAKITADATDGHRGALHSWVGVVGFTALAAVVTFLGLAFHSEVGGSAAAFCALALGLRGLGLARGKVLDNVALFAGCAAFVVFTARAGVSYVWVPAAYFVGSWAHLAGDTFTEHGCPWLWPRQKDYRLGWINTGSWVELGVVTPLVWLLGAAGAIVSFGWWPQVQPVLSAALARVAG